MDTTLNPDLFVMPSQRLDVRTTRFPAAMAPEIAGLPGVERVQMFRNNRITFRGKPAMVAAIEMNSVAEHRAERAGRRNVDDMYREAAAGEGVIVVGQLRAAPRPRPWAISLEIPAPYGMIRLPIVGIIVDFVDQQGTVFMDRAVFLQYWQDDTVSDFRVFLDPGTNIADVRQRIIERYAGERHVFVLTNEEARQYILRIADQWFGLMNVQIGIAVLVAILGIVNTLTVSITDRRRELGVLQAVGALRGQIRGARSGSKPRAWPSLGSSSECASAPSTCTTSSKSSSATPSACVSTTSIQSRPMLALVPDHARRCFRRGSLAFRSSGTAFSCGGVGV